MFRFLTVFFLGLFLFSCSVNNTSQKNSTKETHNAEQKEDYSFDLTAVLANAHLPESVSSKILESAIENPAFFQELYVIMQEDPFLWVLVDKEHRLDSDYEPEDLVELKSGSYTAARAGLFLRDCAVKSLEEMADAAIREGVIFMASSAYRSYSYQRQVYERYLNRQDWVALNRTALPGQSQHQLGLAVDFGSITDYFTQTAEERWLSANASRFGWSLSYPRGYENVTGYREESWHYRYVGKELAKFIDNYFGGIQQYALRFIYEKQKLDIS
jgi:D-alanyl-D-alanine carboxypeptidase